MRGWQGWTLGALLMVAGETAVAEASADGIVRQLREQGYVEFSVDRTWLGRIQVIAQAPDGTRREIVFSPGTGEILRDYVEAREGSSNTPRLLDPSAGESARGARSNDVAHDRQGNGGGRGQGSGQGQGQGNGQGGNPGKSNGNGR